jgi:hypothetical protein
MHFKRNAMRFLAQTEQTLDILLIGNINECRLTQITLTLA